MATKKSKPTKKSKATKKPTSGGKKKKSPPYGSRMKPHTIRLRGKTLTELHKAINNKLQSVATDVFCGEESITLILQKMAV